MEIIIKKKILVQPENLLTGEVVKLGNSADIRVPKKYIGKKVYIILRDE